MRVFAISDLHLSLATPGKNMDVFGEHWRDHHVTVERNWRDIVRENDLVLVTGDISWAMRLEGARADIDHIGQLPGTKVLIRGNHDFWWESIKKIRAMLPPRMYALQNDAVRVGSALVAGVRLWDTPGICFDAILDKSIERGGSGKGKFRERGQDDERIHRRELGRLQLSLEALGRLSDGSDNELRIAVTHYPPCDVDMAPTEATELFHRHGIRHAAFGHLHNVLPELPRPFGARDGIHYHLVTCDYVDFTPKLIAEVE